VELCDRRHQRCRARALHPDQGRLGAHLRNANPRLDHRHHTSRQHGPRESATVRTVDSNGRMVLATGHATPEEHLMLAREGRARGLQVLLTHPGDIPQVAEAAKLGAFSELTASNVYKAKEQGEKAAAFIKKNGAQNIIVSTDCGQTTNV